MKRAFFTALLFTTLLTTATAQYFPVDTARLNSAYRAIVRGPNTLEKQQDFLAAFPTTYMEFYYTYQYIEGNNYDLAMTRMVNAHLTVLKDSLYLISDSLYCNKLVNLAVGMNDTGEITSHLQEIIHMAMLKHEKTMMFAVMRLFKAYQLQFWSFYWSSVAYSESWTEHFENYIADILKIIPMLCVQWQLPSIIIMAVSVTPTNFLICKKRDISKRVINTNSTITVIE